MSHDNLWRKMINIQELVWYFGSFNQKERKTGNLTPKVCGRPISISPTFPPLNIDDVSKLETILHPHTRGEAADKLVPNGL